VALKEARSAMGEEAKKILADNNRMFEELKFHHNEAADMQVPIFFEFLVVLVKNHVFVCSIVCRCWGYTVL